MTRNRLTITTDDRIAVVRGWRARDLVREAGLKSIFSASAGGWMIDQPKLGDLLAYLDERNITAHLVDANQPTLDGGDLDG